MRPEAQVSPNERILGIWGRLSNSLVKELDEKFIPQFIESQKKRGAWAGDKAIIDRYFQRNRAQDDAYATAYAYADIDRSRKYNRLLPLNPALEPLKVDCTIDHIVCEAWIPFPNIEHGHKHILFLNFAEGPPSCIQTYDTWAALVQAPIDYYLSDDECSSHRRGE